MFVRSKKQLKIGYFKAISHVCTKTASCTISDISQNPWKLTRLEQLTRKDKVRLAREV